MSGSISGTIKDSQGAVVPGAHIILKDTERSAERKMDSGAEGNFMFDLLAPSAYTLTVEAAGFKSWKKENIRLYAADRIGMGSIALEVGQVSETVTVEANTAQLQTESAKIEGTVTSQMMTDLSVRDRNFMYLLKTIPGVVPDTNNGRGVNINGGRADQASFKLDGLVNNDYGDNGCCSIAPSMDAVAEMKVVTNGATADMGVNGSSQVLIVTKGGSTEFHGSAYMFKRAEWLNATSWTNNYNNINPRKPRDRRDQVGFTLGGPLYIPGLFNVKKDKLFFFVNAELQKQTSPSSTAVNVPTALERTGNFSQSIYWSDGVAANVQDPLTKDSAGVMQSFPDKIIPSNRLDPDGMKLMNKVPLPSRTWIFNQQSNYFRQNSPSYTDNLQKSYRLDYNVNEKWRIYGRWTQAREEQGNATGMGSFELDSSGKTMGWTLQTKPSYSGLINITTILSPTATNEFVGGTTRTKDRHQLDKVTYTRASLGLAFQLPYPNSVKGDYGPQTSFADSGWSGGYTLGSSLPYLAISPDYNLTDNFTKIFARHTVKAGVFFDWNRKDQDRWGGVAHAGNISIGRQITNNPYDTNYQMSNLATGAFNSFQQASKVPEGRYYWKQLEFYVADTWKAKSNLTIDLGVRFYMEQPQYDSKGQIATFLPSLYDRSKTVRLYSHAVVNGKNVVVDPANPSVVIPNYMYGAIVPNSGDINNGFTLAGQNGVPRGLLAYQGIMGAPRVGLAWQPGFLPKTVIRASSGVFYDRVQGNVIFESLNVPPTYRTQSMLYGKISDISNAKYVQATPPQIDGGYTGSGKIPTTVNWNFAIQRELPRAITAEVAYVGSISRHLIFRYQFNDAPWGSAWKAENQDPWVTPQYNGKTTLPANFWRNYPGIARISEYTSSGSSNYHALQVQINKRMSRKLSFGVAYTFSKTMGLGDSIWGAPVTFDMRKYNYGRVAYDRTHVMNSNIIFNLPKFGRGGNFLDHPGLRLILNDWELTTIIAARSGSPTNFSYSFGSNSGIANQNLELCGTQDYQPRIYVISPWVANQKAEVAQFKTNAFLPPVKPSQGLESGFYYWSNPAIFLSSPEVTMMKNIVFSKDSRRYFQLRLETYNAMNHHDWTGRGMSATFVSPTNATITNMPWGTPTGTTRFGFGALSGAASPRTVQASLKLYF